MSRSAFRKWTRRILRILVVGLVLGLLLIHFVAPRLIVSRKAKPAESAVFDPFRAEMLTIRGHEEIALAAQLVEPMHRDSIRGVLIFIHGIGSNKEAFTDSAKAYAKLGFVSFVFDQRAHGESGGKFITYGYHEKLDLERIVTFLRERYPNLPLGVWGTSLGGAVALQALAHDPRLDYGIVSSTFADLSTVVFEYQRRYLKGIGLRPVTNYALRRAGSIAGFEPAEVRPAEAARHITQPILLIHGDDDRRIDLRHGREIYANLASTDKELIVVPGGDHLNTFKTGGEDLAERVVDFLERVEKR